MAFDRNQSSFGNSLFQPYQHLEDINAGGENSGGMGLPFVSVPSGLQQEQDTASYVSWSHSIQDDPYDINRCPQSSSKIRKLTDTADCDGETELQGLVSNILDEVDSQDNYYSGRGLPTCNPFWSPKTLREELLQYFQSETKTHHNPSFPPNHVSQETLNKRQQQQSVDINIDQLSQSSGFASNQQWLFNATNGDFYSGPQKPPPGLPIPNTGNTYLSHIQQDKYAGVSACSDRENGQSMNSFPDLSDIFKVQSEMNSNCFDAFNKDKNINSGKPVCNGQYSPGNINQLVSSFQSLMAVRDDACRGDFPTLQKQTVVMQQEDSIAEQWKITNPAISTQSTPAMQMPNQLVGEFGTVQREGSGVLRRQMFKPSAFQDLSDFSPQNTEYYQQPKPLPVPITISDQYQNKITMHRESINVNMNPFSKHHNQQSQIRNKIKPQMHKENKRLHIPGFLGEGYPRRPQTNSHMTEGEKQTLSQNPFFDFQGSVQLTRFDGENSMVGTGNIQQFMYPVNDPNISMKSHFNSRAMLGPHYGGGMSGVDAGDMTLASESAAFNSYISDMRTCRGESTYHGMGSAMTTLMLMKQGGPVIQLYFYLDECYEQLRCLEKERKETQHVLTKAFFGKRTAAGTNNNLPKTPPNPTRVEHLIVNQMREQGKVASLLDRMECLSNLPIHNNIQTALNRHHMAICITQARCKEDITSKHQQQRPPFTDDRDTLLMVMALKDLAATTRKLRTALWCALQMTLLKTDKMQDHPVSSEDTNRCTSPCKSYSFKL